MSFLGSGKICLIWDSEYTKHILARLFQLIARSGRGSGFRTDRERRFREVQILRANVECQQRCL